MNNLHRYNVLILAAGQSQRMGRPKMLLPFDEKKTFLTVVVEGYRRFGCGKIIVVVNETGKALLHYYQLENNIQIVVNPHPEWKRFYSIQLGLQAMEASKGVFIHNIDNPFVQEEVLKKLSAGLRENNYAVPVFNRKGGHPILISKKIVEGIITYQDTTIHFKEYLQNFVRVDVPVNKREVLTNINTPEEYRVFDF